MNVTLLEYLDYPENRPPLIGLYVCKVACEASIDFRSDHIYMWAEWTGEGFDFGDRWHLKPGEEAAVLGWAYSPEHSRMQDAPLVRADLEG
jgi:hypothetical protein